MDEKNRPKPEQVANLKKESPQKEFLKRFINTDMVAIRNSWIEERLMPGIYDLGMFLWDKLWEKDGKPTTFRSSLGNSGNNKTAYHSKYRFVGSKTSQNSNTESDSIDLSKPDYDKIIVETRDDAIKITKSMNDYILEFKEMDRGDLYSMVGVPKQLIDFNDAKWGWTIDDWTGASFERVPGGYYHLLLPRIKHISND